MQDDKNKQPGLSWTAPAASTVKEAATKTSAPSSAAWGNRFMLETQAPVYAGLVVGGIIVGVLLSTAWSAFGGKGTIADTASSTQKTASVADAEVKVDSISSSGSLFTVTDQKAGGNVAVTKLALTKPTWIVVYANRDGKPGNALGARLFFAGDKQGSVALLRNTAVGQTYFVGLRTDNGDKVFSLAKDKATAGEDGQPLLVTFKSI
jgi:hypothetical protein